MTGEDVLAQIVQLSKGSLTTEGWVAIGDVAQRLTGSPDGRKISARLKRLEAEKLIERKVLPKMTWVAPTHRGRTVDRIYENASAARGGRFVPKVQLPVTWEERMALRR